MPDVPEDLLTPVEVPARRIEILTDVGLVLADHVEALELANDRIRGVRCVLEGVKSGGELECSGPVSDPR
ncbi:hypothetical protein [Mameliella sp. LZ-28]|uniref:hypothetical protein n=1 Tax=Mameliella sp. LZ-28 TaxID=2484146 RepID=UPI001B2FFA2F|nr:hypothetical protein [Mameliella sp. LZ-28]MCR9274408.1 hypothetical protein [Paracoccaceae bacterium]